MRAFEEVARAAASRAGALLRARYAAPQAVSFKSEVDLLTAADRDAERLIVDALREAFPEHGVVAEESPAVPGAGPYRWYVDPLDGTTNFAHGHPHFAVSLGLARDEELLLGVVHDPLRGETFVARRGEGARLGDRPITVSSVATLDRALMATGFPYDRRHHAAYYLAYVQSALERTQGLRRAGSAALDLCWVACGRLDGFWEWKLQPWDTAAGRLVVEEAGGAVSDVAGGPLTLAGPEIVASNGLLHGELLAMLRQVRARVGPLPAAR
ncbi:MAG TPA: inositol monophosphatase family protein [Candidatus Binatia bacterium]|nr:inositol monophosphatase family protein [Candidatus Binatia bacterium]